MPCPGLRDRGAACQRVEAADLGPGPCCRWEVVLARRPERGWGAGSRGAAHGAFPPSAGPAAQGPRWGGHYMPGTHKGSPSPKPEDTDACPVSCAQ